MLGVTDCFIGLEFGSFFSFYRVCKREREHVCVFACDTVIKSKAKEVIIMGNTMSTDNEAALGGGGLADCGINVRGRYW